MCRRAGGALEPALHVRFELTHEGWVRELIGEDGRDAEGDGGRDALLLERVQRFDQRQVAIERGLTQPHAAVWPAAVMQNVRQVTVEGQDEIHGGPSDGRWRLVPCWSRAAYG